jgi:hypothetical protein
MPFFFFNYNKGDAMDTQKEITVFLAEFDFQIKQVLKVYSILVSSQACNVVLSVI